MVEINSEYRFFVLAIRFRWNEDQNRDLFSQAPAPFLWILFRLVSTELGLIYLQQTIKLMVMNQNNGI